MPSGGRMRLGRTHAHVYVARGDAHWHAPGVGLRRVGWEFQLRSHWAACKRVRGRRAPACCWLCASGGGYACRGETRAHVCFARSIRCRRVPGVILRRMSRGGRPNSLGLVLTVLRVNGVHICADSIYIMLHGGQTARSRLSARLHL